MEKKSSDKKSVKKQVNSVKKMDHRIKKAIPYLIYSLLYIVYYEYLHAESTSMKIPFKAISILYLCVLVQFTPLKNTRYNRTAVFAFVFTLTADGCMSKPQDYLVHALFSYAHAHIARTIGFGFSPIALNIGTIVVPIGLAMYAYLSPGLVGSLTYLVATYITFLCLMLWRSLARAYYTPHTTERPLSGKILGIIGVLFVILANFNLAIDIFLEDKPDHMEVFISVPHYLGQLMFALSAI